MLAAVVIICYMQMWLTWAAAFMLAWEFGRG